MARITAAIQSTPSKILLAVTGIGALALILAITALTWLQVPAPGPGALGYSDLKALTDTPNVPTTTIQHAYFAWLSWTLLVVVVAIAVAAVLLRTRLAGAAAAVAAVVALVLQVLAAKGPMTWSAFFDTFDQFRIGAYFALGSWVLLLVVAVAVIIAARTTVSARSSAAQPVAG